MDKVIKATMGASFILTVGLILFWIGITWYPFQAARFYPPVIITPYVQAGDLMIYNMVFDKYTAVRPKIQRVLISEKKGNPLIVLENAIGVSRMGQNTRQIRVEIPKSVEPGKYRLLTFLQYPYFGGLRMVEYEIYTDVFEVYR